MGKAEFGLAVLPSKLKDNICACPLGPVFDEVNLAVHNVPDHFLAGYPFRNLLGAVVQVAGVERKLTAGFIGSVVNIF